MAVKKTEDTKTTAVKQATDKKVVDKKPVAEKKAPAKKTPAKKAAPKTAEKKVVTKIQFGGKEIDTDEIIEACKADYKTKTNGHVRSLNVYIKPEESAAYYVVNDKYSDKVDL